MSRLGICYADDAVERKRAMSGCHFVHVVELAICATPVVIRGTIPTSQSQFGIHRLSNVSNRWHYGRGPWLRFRGRLGGLLWYCRFRRFDLGFCNARRFGNLGLLLLVPASGKE